MASDCRCCPPDTEQSHEATDWPQPKVRESPRWLFLRGSYSLSAAMIVASTDPCSAIYAEISCATVARSAPASQYREAICAFRLVLKILTSALRLEHCSSRRNFRIREACRKRDAGTAHTVDMLPPSFLQPQLDVATKTLAVHPTKLNHGYRTFRDHVVHKRGASLLSEFCLPSFESVSIIVHFNHAQR